MASLLLFWMLRVGNGTVGFVWRALETLPLDSIWVLLFLNSETSSDQSAGDCRSLIKSEERVGSSLALSIQEGNLADLSRQQWGSLMSVKGSLAGSPLFSWRNHILAESVWNLVILVLLSKYKVMCQKGELFFFFIPSVTLEILLREGLKVFFVLWAFLNSLFFSLNQYLEA